MNTQAKFTVAQRLGIAFGSIIVIFAAVSGISLYSSAKLAEADRWNVHTYKVIDTAQDMLADMVNMETGARGFLIAGEDRYLEPWKAGLAGFDKQWSEGKQLTADNPVQQKRLDDMKARQTEFKAVGEALIAARGEVRAGKKTMVDFTAEFAQGKDKAAMDGFRALAADYAKAEESLLAERSATAENLRSFNRASIIGGSLLALIAAAALGLWITRSIVRQLGGEPDYAAQVALRVADGDLAFVVNTRDGDTTSLLAAMKSMQQRLGSVVGSIRNASDSIATGSSQIATGNADLSQRTEEQASNLQQTAASMEQLSSTVKNNADTARQATQLASSASNVAARGGQVVGQVVSTMNEISNASRKIADIIGVIDGIAFQTNILALNAAVEAARAGEQGRGFAVVASEVRNLAQRSAQAAKEIKTLIGDSVEKVEAGGKQVDEAGQTMEDIVAQVKRVADLIGEISSATLEQTSGIGQVSDAVSQLDQVTQQNAALVEESAAAAESLKHQAQALVQSVSQFRVAA